MVFRESYVDLENVLQNENDTKNEIFQDSVRLLVNNYNETNGKFMSDGTDVNEKRIVLIYLKQFIKILICFFLNHSVYNWYRRILAAIMK